MRASLSNPATILFEQIIRKTPLLKNNTLPTAQHSKAILANWEQQIIDAFSNSAPINVLLSVRALCIDYYLYTLWQHTFGEVSTALALVAVGGYGRAELHPKSDIDLLILGSTKDINNNTAALEQFITTAWDVGLEIGHSVRTPEECIKLAKQDLNTATNIMESRWLTGNQQLLEKVTAKTNRTKIWPVKKFFQAKYQEQINRHHRYQDSSYLLEPNIKGTPGGLRDIQTICWITQRQYGAASFNNLLERELITSREHQVLSNSRDFLWKLRFALHHIANRKEDRLLFDYQKKVAAFLGYKDNAHQLAIEQLMKAYYRTVMNVRELNEMLLKLFEASIHETRQHKITDIDEQFECIDNQIAIKNDQVLSQNPSGVLELFLHFGKFKKITGINVTTIRALRQARTSIDDQFRLQEQNQALFLEILKLKGRVGSTLAIMKRHGILGAYLPEFDKIIGQMQYDLFHFYTVDEHTIFLLKVIDSFIAKETEQTHPLCYTLFSDITKPELLYIAAIYHDIAKGRGGDHSELGVIDVTAFADRHQLDEYSKRLLPWLVKNHLLLSVTAQKKDTFDPDVLNDFASKVRDKTHLDYLYLLTAADITATNPTLWNGWRASLLQDLYIKTKNLLSRGLDSPINKKEIIKETKLDTLALLEKAGLSLKSVLKIWTHFDDKIFLSQTSEELAWQTIGIFNHGDTDAPLIAVKNFQDTGATTIFFYGLDQDYLFSAITSALVKKQLNIVNAKIVSVKNYAFDLFYVIEPSGKIITNKQRQNSIVRAIQQQLNYSDRCLVTFPKKLPRKMRFFRTETDVMFHQDSHNNRTIIEVNTLDRVGLLARIASVFVEFNILLQDAKIVTIGERVEDMFYVTDLHMQPIKNITKQIAIKEAIQKSLAYDNPN